ncbi:tetratricopeptide repeat protein [Rhodothermus bifroesti]|uniref:tetratricopeptide repeat protein n=1 Tax=Rhodothermus bifroesti TaxID=2823335 RepID=UPI00311AA541
MVQQLTAQLAQAYRAGNRAQVLLLADSLCQIAPERPEGYVWKAALLRELGQLSQAEALLYEALARAPAHPEARLLLARVVEQQGHLRKAVSLYNQALRQAEGLLRAAAWLGLGHLYQALGQADSAAVAFLEALRLDSTLAEAWDGLRQLYETEGRYPEALQAARKALRWAPEKVDYQLALGMLLARTGQTAEAVAMLRAVVAARPWQLAAHYQLGRLLNALGDAAEGQYHLQQAEAIRCLAPLLTQAELEVARHAEALSLLKLARRLLAQGYAAETRQAVEAAYALQPQSSALANLAGRLVGMPLEKRPR